MDKYSIGNEACDDSDIFMKEFDKDKQNKEIEQFKLQNEHISQINGSLMQVNKMLKHDLQEINKKYLELVQVVEEAVKRRKIAKEQNIQLIREKKEIEERLIEVQKEYNMIQNKADALDGIAVLAEAARRL